MAINIAAVNGGTYMKLAHFKLPDPPTVHLGRPIMSDEYLRLGTLLIIWERSGKRHATNSVASASKRANAQRENRPDSDRSLRSLTHP